ncbi:MAG: hydrogen peroxide-inducible genes activator [Saprospiraceae bacterium]
MTLQQLQYIVALDNHRHFVKAAESCHVAQPTLTLQVKKLEDQIGVALFDRSTKPLKPTSIGTLFIVKARQILREIQQLKELVNNQLSQVEGTFKIGIIPTLAPYLLPKFLGNFAESFPNTRLEILEMQSEYIIKSLKHDLIDIGLLATPLKENDIREIPLFYEPFLIYSNRENPILEKGKNIRSDELKPEGLWILGQGHCFRNQTLNVCDFDPLEDDRNFNIEGGSIETLKNMIEQSEGYTLIPELSYKPKQEKSNVIRFSEPQPVREISLAVHKNFTKEQLLVELRKSIISAVPDSFSKNKRFITVNWR